MNNENARKSCQDKAGWVSVQEARAAITQADWQHGKTKNQKLEPYLCDKCKLYHLASKYSDGII